MQIDARSDFTSVLLLVVRTGIHEELADQVFEHDGRLREQDLTAVLEIQVRPACLQPDGSWRRAPAQLVSY